MPRFARDELDAVGLWRERSASPPLSAQAIARAATTRVLNALAAWGTLKTESIAALCFPPARYSRGLALAQRKLKSMSAAKLVIARVDAHGTRSWVLTATGGAMVGSRHGLDLSPGGAAYTHTHLTARYLIYKHIVQGYSCYSEYALAHGRCPLRTNDLLVALGKIPDGILIDGSRSAGRDAAQLVYALETEVAAKSLAVISNQLGMLAHLGKLIRSDLPFVFGGLIVLFPAEMEWHASRLASAARRRWHQSPVPSLLAEHVLLARADLGPTWAFKGVSETKLCL